MISETRFEFTSIQTPTAVLKVLELVLAIFCAVLHYHSCYDDAVFTGFLATGTFCGYVVIMTTVVIGKIPRKENIFTDDDFNIFRISYKDSAT
jgi:hypothetical protein